MYRYFFTTYPFPELLKLHGKRSKIIIWTLIGFEGAGIVRRVTDLVLTCVHRQSWTYISLFTVKDILGNTQLHVRPAIGDVIVASST